jgi:hypothetical protein
MILPRVACKYDDVTVAATLPNGQPATLAGVDMALVLPGGSPDRATVWKASTYANGVASILIAGPEYPTPPDGALVASPAGGDLWARVTDTPEVDAALVDRITLL